MTSGRCKSGFSPKVTFTARSLDEHTFWEPWESVRHDFTVARGGAHPVSFRCDDPGDGSAAGHGLAVGGGAGELLGRLERLVPSRGAVGRRHVHGAAAVPR